MTTDQAQSILKDLTELEFPKIFGFSVIFALFKACMHISFAKFPFALLGRTRLWLLTLFRIDLWHPECLSTPCRYRSAHKFRDCI